MFTRAQTQRIKKNTSPSLVVAEYAANRRKRIHWKHILRKCASPQSDQPPRPELAAPPPPASVTL